MSKLAEGVVLIQSSEADKNGTFGTAFIICHDSNGFNYLLTCAHVIEQINGGNQAENKLRIVGLNQPVEIVKCGSSDTIDIAVLKTSGLTDRPVFDQFVLGREQSDVRINGYSSFDAKAKQWVKRELNGKLGKKITLTANNDEFLAWDISIQDDSFSKLDGGYSGSPLYNQADQIIGIVSHRRSGELGHAFCISNLAKLYPEITTLLPGFDKLAINSRLAQIRTGLINRINDINEVYPKITARLNQIDKQGLDEDAEFFLDTCESFISKPNAKSFVKYCQALENETAGSGELLNYQELARRLNNGEIALCLGAELPALLDSKLTPAAEYPRSIASLAGLEQAEHRTLSEVCEYAELNSDRCTRRKVVGELQKLTAPPVDHTPNIALYDLLARLQKPFLVIAGGFDTLLEQRLRNSGRRFVSVIANAGAESAEKNLILNYSDRETSHCSDEQLSALRLMENGYSLIYHPRGYPDEQQDALVLISERDYFNATDLLNKRYPDYLHTKLKSLGLWFLGYHPDSWETRLLAKVLHHQRMNKNESNRNQALVIQQNADSFARFFWREIQCRHYNDISLAAFVANIEAAL